MATQPHRTEELQQTSFLIILAVVTLLMAVVIYPFAQPLLWAGLAAIMFQPLYRNVLRRLRGRRNPAAGLSLLIIFILVLVPAAWVASMVIQQAFVLVTTLQQQPIDLAVLFDTVYTRLPQFAREAVDRSGWADIAMVQTRLQELLTESAGMIASQAVSIGSGALSFFLSFGVALYVMFFLLRDGERIGRTVLCAVPVERSIADRLAERFLGIVRATIKGTGVVALVQGALGTVTLMIAGVPSALLFGVIMLSRWVLSSKMGRILNAMSEKEDRVRFSGYDVSNFKIFIFALAAAISGIGGAMFVLQVGFISPSLVGIVPSIEMVIFAAVGGKRSLLGAVYGTLLVNTGKSLFSETFPQLWLYAMGGLFIVVVMLMPNGVAGVWSDYVKPWFSGAKKRLMQPPPVDKTEPAPSTTTTPAASASPKTT